MGISFRLTLANYDNVYEQRSKILPVPFLAKDAGYLINLSAYYKDLEALDIGIDLEADLEVLELNSQRGANLSVQVAGSYGITWNPPISRKGNPNDYFAERPRILGLRENTERYDQTLRLLVPQILTVKAVDTGEVLFHNQTLEQQLQEFEKRVKQR